MLLQDGSDVPLWMTPQQRVATNFSQYDDTYVKDKTKYELLSNLKSADVNISVEKVKGVGELQDIYHRNLIYVTNIGYFPGQITRSSVF